jgi:hypothetical protein
MLLRSTKGKEPMGMFRSALSKVAWVGRTASMVFGLALVMALILGAATMAFGANGDFFKIGKTNLASAVSVLTKSGAGPALSLKVDRGAPLAVNSDAKVGKLNADELDGLDSARLAGTGDSAYRGGSSVCGPGGAPFTSTLPVSVRKESLLFATARAGVQANGNANASTLMNVELRNADNNTTLASTGFSSQAFSANSTDVRDLVSEGVLKSGISSPSEVPFVLKPGVDYVLRMTVSLNGGTCTGSSPMIWSSSLSYIQLGKP